MAYYVGMLKMTLKDWWSDTSKWLRSHGFSSDAGIDADIDDEGYISQKPDSVEAEPEQVEATDGHGNNSVVVRAGGPDPDKTQSIEKLEEGFNQLVGQLQGINEHLNRQVNQHAELMERIEKLPEWLASFPAVVEGQKQITDQLLEQVKGAAAKQERFIDAVEKMPTETAKQTDALVGIDHQLAAAADTDVQMVENFNKFSQTLERLNQSTEGQTDGILQMSKTFATSDRYLKYIVSKQNKRFVWIFIAAISVCVFVILILTGVIIYLKS
jgi:archaellum component FlaC